MQSQAKMYLKLVAIVVIVVILELIIITRVFPALHLQTPMIPWAAALLVGVLGFQIVRRTHGLAAAV